MQQYQGPLSNDFMPQNFAETRTCSISFDTAMRFYLKHDEIETLANYSNRNYFKSNE